MSAPVLSICIPAYNRPELLRDCLATVLPQVARRADRVECIVCDDASPRDPGPAIAGCAALGPFTYLRNPRNIGSHANFIRLTTELARGEFVWLLGDDDTLKAGGLDRVLAALSEHGDRTDLLVLNYDHADGRHRPPPDRLTGGVGDVGAAVVRSDRASGLRRLDQLLCGEGGAFTPMYTLVIRRRLWAEFAARHPHREAYTSVEWTYPHAVLVAEAMAHKPAGYVGEPVLTLFDISTDEMSWARHSLLITTVRFLELLRCFERNGVPRAAMDGEYRVAEDRLARCLPRLLWDPAYAGGLGVIPRLWRLLPGRRRSFLRTLREAMTDDLAPAWVRSVARAASRVRLALWRLRGRPGVAQGRAG